MDGLLAETSLVIILQYYIKYINKIKVYLLVDILWPTNVHCSEPIFFQHVACRNFFGDFTHNINTTGVETSNGLLFNLMLLNTNLF